VVAGDCARSRSTVRVPYLAKSPAPKEWPSASMRVPCRDH
jgi:hypothetical protein